MNSKLATTEFRNGRRGVGGQSTHASTPFLRTLNTGACRVTCSALLLLLLAACTNASPTETPTALKLYLSDAGVYRVTRAELQARHADFTSDLTHLRLTHKGSDVPLDLDASGDALLFYAAPVLTAYGASDVYWLASSDTPTRMTTRSVEPLHDEPATSYSATLTLEENRLYSASAFGATHWFWQSFTAPATRTITTTLDALGAGDAQLSVALAGGTDGNHTVQIVVNDTTVGEARWMGRDSFVFTFDVSTLRVGDNTISLRAAGRPGEPEVNLLDALTLRYPRQLVAIADSLDFQARTSDVRVRGFNAEAITVYDISDAQHLQKLSGITLRRDGGASVVAFSDSLTNRHYLAFASNAARKVKEIRAAHANNLRAREQHADELIIAPAQFLSALQPLVKHHGEHGVSAQLVDVEQVYDAFGDGVAAPQAIRDFIAYARTQRQSPPRFVLLVGKASYDYHDYLNAPNKNLLPTYLVPTPHLGEAASDNWFVTQSDADPHPALAIGRIPAKSAAQVSTAVEKIIAYETMPRAQDWQARATFAADDKEPTFKDSSNALIQQLPASLSAQKIFLSDFGGDVNAARVPLIQQWNAGLSLLTYIGHGSLDTWAAGPLFSADNLSEIKNGARLPILFTPTCLDGFFYHPQKDSLAENLLFKSDGGMIAGLVPTGLSLPTAQDEMMRALFDQLFVQHAPTLGEAIMQAKRHVAADTPETREVLDTFVLLGDPALVNPFASR